MSTADIIEQLAAAWNKTVDAPINPASFGVLHEKELDPLERARWGSHYTPIPFVRAALAQACIDASTPALICDPACGGGGFLLEALRHMYTKTRHNATPPTAEELSEHLVGFDIDPDACRITRAALTLLTRQLDGSGPSRAQIVHANALTTNWRTLLPERKRNAPLVIVGNPPFGAGRTLDQQTRRDLVCAWKGHPDGNKDVITGFIARAMDCADRFTFIVTSSLVQGQWASALAKKTAARGFSISHARGPYQWDGEAGVTCATVTWEKHPITYSLNGHTARPAITPYLTEGAADFVVHPRRSGPVSGIVLPARYGSKPADGGAFFVDDPGISPFVRPFIGAEEILHGTTRWCLWLKDVTDQEIRDTPILASRVAKVRAFRQASTKEATRSTPPHLFAEDRHTDDDTRLLAVPLHVSEKRLTFPARHVPAGTIIGNACSVIPDPDGVQLAVLSSRAFLIWQKMIGGRLDNRLRFAATLTWNTFPLPEEGNEDLADASRQLIAARKGMTLLQCYANRSFASCELADAHARIDRIIDQALGLDLAGGATDAARAERLTALYATRCL